MSSGTAQGTNDPVEEHRSHLGNALLYAAAAYAERRAGKFSWARKNFAFALAGCRAAIAARAGCSAEPNSVLGFLVRRRENDWLPDVLQLWQEYRAAGMIDLDAPVSVDDALVTLTEKMAFPSGDALPLEATIVRGNVQFLGMLLAAGADITKVPSRDYDSRRDLLWEKRAGPVTDILSFIECKVQDTALANVLQEVIVAHMLQQGISRANKAGSDDSAARPPRARRARVV